MPAPRTLAELALYLRDGGKTLEKQVKLANRANAELIGSRIRDHIAKDDLPLTALSSEWVRFKLSRGKKANHLWYQGIYLANFRVVERGATAIVGTNRPVVNSSFNLPQYLETRFPVWRYALDLAAPDLKANYAEAVQSALQNRRSKPLKRR